VVGPGGPCASASEDKNKITASFFISFSFRS
jgi:hypothetical protein